MSGNGRHRLHESFPQIFGTSNYRANPVPLQYQHSNPLFLSYKDLCNQEQQVNTDLFDKIVYLLIFNKLLFTYVIIFI